MKDMLTRKDFIRKGSKVAAGVVVGTAALNIIEDNHASAKAQFPAWPWAYVTIDPEKVRVYGHDEYFSGKGCCAGAFTALVRAIGEEAGEPWTSFPVEMMLYGAGGGAGWGATCGAINGAGAFINMVNDKATASKLVNELFGWYTQADLPTDASNQLAIEDKYTVPKLGEALPQNKSKSPLCHVSVTEWCGTADKKVGDLERLERCGRLTGDVAAYAAQLLNDNLMGEFNPLYVTPDVVTNCNACHSANGVVGNVASKMECDTCHGDPHSTSGITQLGGLALSYSLGSNYPNPFNPSTSLKFSIPKGEHVTLHIFDNHGRLVAKLLDGEYQSPGEYQVTWNGMSDFGNPASSGTYFARMKAGSFTRTQKMQLVK